MTVLHLIACCEAPMGDRLAVLDYLISEGVQLDAIDYMESTALHAAAALGDTAIVTCVSSQPSSPSPPSAWLAVSRGGLYNSTPGRGRHMKCLKGQYRDIGIYYPAGGFSQTTRAVSSLRRSEAARLNMGEITKAPDCRYGLAQAASERHGSCHTPQ